MEAKNLISFEFEKGDKVYKMVLPHGAPLGDAYEASIAFMSNFVELINKHAEAVTPKKVEEPEKEEAEDAKQSKE